MSLLSRLLALEHRRQRCDDPFHRPKPYVYGEAIRAICPGGPKPPPAFCPSCAGPSPILPFVSYDAYTSSLWDAQRRGLDDAADG